MMSLTEFSSKSRRIEGGGDRISTVSFRKNRFCALLKCVSFIFILNIYVSDSIFSVDFTRAVSFCKQVVSSSFYPSWFVIGRGILLLFQQKFQLCSSRQKLYIVCSNAASLGQRGVFRSYNPNYSGKRFSWFQFSFHS